MDLVLILSTDVLQYVAHILTLVELNQTVFNFVIDQL